MTDNSSITVVLAADDKFSRPLAVAVRSLVAHLRPDRPADVYLLDMGIRPENRAKIAVAATSPAVTVHWISSVSDEVEHLPEAMPLISRATYARLLIPALLPPHTNRALYLDSDLIVRRHVGDLFDTPFERNAAMAVCDAGSPFVSSPHGVPYWSRYGRSADETNFNCGVLLMNLDAWRADNLTAAVFKYLTSGQHQAMADQEAINAVLAGRIGSVDPRWNQQTHIYRPVHRSTLPYDEEQLREILEDPWIVHFSTVIKPWSYGARHPFRHEWYEYLDQTPYRRWRPSRRGYALELAEKVQRTIRTYRSEARMS
jgi:lipopolysaccharide biosynthesis glycosyltransferase